MIKVWGSATGRAKGLAQEVFYSHTFDKIRNRTQKCNNAGSQSFPVVLACTFSLRDTGGSMRNLAEMPRSTAYKFDTADCDR